MSADGPEQREADRLERDTYDHDVAADRADVQPRSPFADSIFEFARANAESARTSFQAGYEQGRHAGYLEAMCEARALLEASMKREVTP